MSRPLRRLLRHSSWARACVRHRRRARFPPRLRRPRRPLSRLSVVANTHQLRLHPSTPRAAPSTAALRSRRSPLTTTRITRIILTTTTRTPHTHLLASLAGCITALPSPGSGLHLTKLIPFPRALLSLSRSARAPSRRFIKSASGPRSIRRLRVPFGLSSGPRASLRASRTDFAISKRSTFSVRYRRRNLTPISFGLRTRGNRIGSSSFGRRFASWATFKAS